MADEAPDRMLLIVTGSTLRAEEVDRPLAYYLKQQVEARLEAEIDPPPVLVIADFRWIHEDSLQRLPTISVGGPGVNVLAQRWLEDLPVSLMVDEQYYIQMDPDLEEPRASIWGIDNPTTQIATSAFIQKFLAPFLVRSATVLDEIEAETAADHLTDTEDDEDGEDD